MIAGIGGASLGTEIEKCLTLAGGYRVFGCDVSRTAYGLYDAGFAKTYTIDRDDYVPQVIGACRDAGADLVVPGGEKPMALLGAASAALAEAGITVVANSPEVVRTFSDKHATFQHLGDHGIQIPKTIAVATASDIEQVGVPCIVKPSTGTGGSVAVFYAVTVDEAMVYAEFIRRSGTVPIAQEYVGLDEGEFTVGVLSLPDGAVVGSIALARVLDAKLSVAYAGRGGLISSGYSQGRIDDFPKLRAQAERIAKAAHSRGPMNVQGRVRDGVLLPFEINPRFSASTYLRALAGFNEVHMLIQYLSTGEVPAVPPLRPGYYLRSLTETYVAPEGLK
jgi:carbamoyl-phosphate synthase large subunit